MAPDSHSPWAGRLLLALGLATALAGGAPGAAPAAEEEAVQPAAGGLRLLPAAESAPRTLVGAIRAPEALDRKAWVATLAVERALAGPGDAGGRVRIAWEELSQARPPRFREGDRVVVALEPLPGWSIWSERLPERDALHVAERGEAFLRAPDAATLDPLERFLRLPPEAREQAPGVDALAALVDRGHPRVARSAIERLDDVPGLAGRLESGATEALASALAGDHRPVRLRQELASLSAERGLRALRPALDAVASAEGDAALRASALEAIAHLEGGALPAARVQALLAHDAPELRAVALRFAPASLEPDPARARVQDDPAPSVRAAAVTALVARRGEAAFDAAAPALFDADQRVRGAAAQALGALGAPVVPRLLALLEGRSGEATAGPVLALSQAGAEGLAALRRLQVEHPDPYVRKLVQFLLDREIDPH